MEFVWLWSVLAVFLISGETRSEEFEDSSQAINGTENELCKRPPCVDPRLNERRPVQHLSEFPYMVALGLHNHNKKNTRYSMGCAGSLVSPTHVLTTAHCVTYSNFKVKFVRAGTIAVPPSTRKINRRYDITVKNVTVHPEYDKKEKKNDIAILELEKSALNLDGVKSACLYEKNDDPADLEAAAWGGRMSVRPLRAGMSAVPLANCQELYSQANRTVLPNQICAGDQYRNICECNSGGPLHLKEDDHFYLVGVKAHGQSCGDRELPQLYVRVSSYLDWIKQYIGPSGCASL